MRDKKKYAIAIIAFLLCAAMFSFALKVQRMYSEKITKEAVSTNISKKETAENKTVSSEGKKDNPKESTASIKNEDHSSEKSSTSAGTAGKAEDKAKTDEISNKGANAESSVKKQASESKSEDKKEESKAAAPKEAGEKTAKAAPAEEMSFTFIDTVNGNKVLLQKQVDMEGEDVGYITCKLLDEAHIKYRTTGGASTIYFAAIDGLEEKKAGKLSGWCYYVKKKGEEKFHKPNVGSGQWIYHNGDVVVWKYLADGIHDGYSDDWDK